MLLASRLFHRTRPVSPSPHRLLAVVSGTTADGVLAHLQVEFSLRALDGFPQVADLDLAAMDAVEDALRRWIGSHEAAALPTAGESLDWVAPDLVTGGVVEYAFVTSADIEVTRELRRLLSSASP